MNILKGFGNTIRFFRNQSSLSQEALANQCGFHRTYIGQIERGERNPSLINIEIFASTFNISLSDLFKKCEELKKLV